MPADPFAALGFVPASRPSSSADPFAALGFVPQRAPLDIGITDDEQAIIDQAPPSRRLAPRSTTPRRTSDVSLSGRGSMPEGRSVLDQRVIESAPPSQGIDPRPRPSIPEPRNLRVDAADLVDPIPGGRGSMRFAQGAIRGAASTLEGLRVFGLSPDPQSQFVAQIGEAAGLVAARPELAPPEAIAKRLTDNPSLLLQSDWWAFTGGNVVGSMIPFAVAGAAGGSAAQGLSPLFRFGAQMVGGAAGESFVNGGIAYVDARKQGATEETAAVIAARVAGEQLPVNTVLALAGYGAGRLGAVSRTAGRVAGAVGEGTSEVAQDEIAARVLRQYGLEGQTDPAGSFVGGLMGGLGVDLAMGDAPTDTARTSEAADTLSARTPKLPVLGGGVASPLTGPPVARPIEARAPAAAALDPIPLAPETPADPFVALGFTPDAPVAMAVPPVGIAPVEAEIAPIAAAPDPFVDLGFAPTLDSAVQDSTRDPDVRPNMRARLSEVRARKAAAADEFDRGAAIDREARGNAAAVEADPDNATMKDLGRAMNYFSHRRVGIIRAAADTGRAVDPDVLNGIDLTLAMLKERYVALDKDGGDGTLDGAPLGQATGQPIGQTPDVSERAARVTTAPAAEPVTFAVDEIEAVEPARAPIPDTDALAALTSQDHDEDAPIGAPAAWSTILGHARANGYTGSQAALATALRDVEGFTASRTSETEDTPRALLTAIRNAGGIANDQSGEVQTLWEASPGFIVSGKTKDGGRYKKTRKMPRGALLGVSGVLRNDGTGLSWDGLREAIAQDPAFRRFADLNATDLVDEVMDAVATVSASPASQTRGVDTRKPGWWGDRVTNDGVTLAEQAIRDDVAGMDAEARQQVYDELAAVDPQDLTIAETRTLEILAPLLSEDASFDVAAFAPQEYADVDGVSPAGPAPLPSVLGGDRPDALTAGPLDGATRREGPPPGRPADLALPGLERVRGQALGAVAPSLARVSAQAPEDGFTLDAERSDGRTLSARESLEESGQSSIFDAPAESEPRSFTPEHVAESLGQPLEVAHATVALAKAAGFDLTARLRVARGGESSDGALRQNGGMDTAQAIENIVRLYRGWRSEVANREPSYVSRGQLEVALATLNRDITHEPEGVYWRGTNRKSEMRDIKGGVPVTSQNWVDGRRERGLSVSEHLGTVFFSGYKFAYKVTGDVIGEGSDGEPLLANVKPISRIYSNDEALALNGPRLDQWHDIVGRISAQTGWDRDHIMAMSYERMPSPRKGKVSPGTADSGTLQQPQRATKAVDTASPEFEAWFGGSKVVNRYGSPIVVYHGTTAKAFDVFDTSAEGAHFGTSEQATNRLAKNNGGGGRAKTIAAYLRITKPLRLPDLGVWSSFNNVHSYLSVNSHITDKQADQAWDAWQRSSAEGWRVLKSALAKRGYDGIVYENELEGSGDSYIAFRPEQIKSADRNTGTFDPTNPSILHQSAPSPFYSRLIRAVEQTPMQKASGYKWKGVIRKWSIGKPTPTLGASWREGINQGELALVGIDDLFDPTTYTKQEILDYLSAHQVTVEDVTLRDSGDDTSGVRTKLRDTKDALETHLINTVMFEPFVASGFADDVAKGELSDKRSAILNADGRTLADALRSAYVEHQRRVGSQPQFSKYQEPGADPDSYREVFLSVPNLPQPQGRTYTVEDIRAWVRNGEDEPSDTSPLAKATDALTDLADRMERGESFTEIIAEYRAAPLRSKVRGARALTIDYAALKQVLGLTDPTAWNDGHAAYRAISNPIVRLRFNTRTTEDGARVLFVEEVQPPSPGNQQKMPPLFVKHWREIGFKWAIRHASEQGLDGVAWTPGKVQADRYSLRKQVSKIEYEPVSDPAGTYEVVAYGLDGAEVFREDEIPLSRVEELVGKDIAGRIERNEGDKRGGGYRDWRTLTGDNLEVGGDGLTRLYDVDFRNVVHAIPAVKKAGAKVEQAVLPDVGTAPILRITPAIRDAVLAGQPLFQSRRAAPTVDTLIDALGRDATATLLAALDFELTASGQVQGESRQGDSARSNGPGTMRVVPFTRVVKAISEVKPTDYSYDGDEGEANIPELVTRAKAALGNALYQPNQDGPNGARGSIEFLTESGQAIIRGFASADASTGIHEVAHAIRRFLLNREVPANERAEVTDADIDAVERGAGVQDGRWTTANEERFAEQVVQYVREGKAPSVPLQSVFAKFAVWLKDIFDTLSGQRGTVSPEMRAVLDRVFTRQERLTANAQRQTGPPQTNTSATASRPPTTGPPQSRSGSVAEASYRDPSVSVPTARSAPKAGAVPVARVGTSTLGPTVNPIEFTELVELAQTIHGMTPKVKKAIKGRLGTTGMFRGNDGIDLLASLFKAGNETELAETLAHEIGHLVDWLPTKTLTRGNILGRLFTLDNFLKHTFMPPNWMKVSKTVIDEELARVSMIWRPWDEKTASTGYATYRKSGKERYADALSMLLNDPGQLETEAPTFYREFFAALDQKPDVALAYRELQTLLHGTPADLATHRRSRVREMYATGTEAWRRAEAAKRETNEKTRKITGELLSSQLLDKHAPFAKLVKSDIARGVVVPEHEDPRFALAERNYIGGVRKAFMARHIDPLVARLKTATVELADLDEALFYERIIGGDQSQLTDPEWAQYWQDTIDKRRQAASMGKADATPIGGDRAEMANPLGITPAVAHNLHRALKADLGADKWNVLRRELTTFRQVIKDVSIDAADAGLYTDEMRKQIADNDSYATFRVIDYIDKAATSRIAQQIGTLKDIASPFTAMVEKALVTMTAAAHNRTKTLAVNYLKHYHADESPDAPMVWNGKRQEPREPENRRTHELVTYLVKGKVRGVHVRSLIAHSINNEAFGAAWAPVRVIRAVNNAWLRPMFTTLNIAFQTINVSRDFVRTWKHRPFWALIKGYRDAVPIAKARAFGPPEAHSATSAKAWEDLLQAEEHGLLSVTFNDYMHMDDVEDTQLEGLFAQSGLAPVKPRSGARRVVQSVTETIKNLGDFMETLPKAAVLLDLKGKGQVRDIGPERRNYVRTKVGSPDFLAGGTFKPITNQVFLFSHAILTGWTADLSLATDPKTRAEWWWKTVAFNVAPKAMLAALYYGVGGDDEDDKDTWRSDARRMLRRVSEYDLTNYLVVPLGEVDDKTLYLRLPQDDTGRVVGGLVWKLAKIASGERRIWKAFQDVFAYGTGTLPSLNPAFENIAGLVQYASGNNIYDSFRGRMVFTQEEMARQDWSTVGKFLRWEADNMGLSAFTAFLPSDRVEKTTPVDVVNKIPVLGRWLKTSDYGVTERLREVQGDVAQDEARTRQRERKAVSARVRAYMALPPPSQTAGTRWALAREIVDEVYADSPPGERAERTARVVKKIAMGAVKGTADPLTEAVLSATSNAQKIGIIREAKKRMPANDYTAWMASARVNSVVSAEVGAQVAAR